MAAPAVLRRATLVVLWTYGLWYSWECGGLAGDGSYFLFEIVHAGGWLPYEFVSNRFVPNFLSQIPVAVAIDAGVTDLQWLARWLSFGWFALPASLYSLALVRARDDAVLQASVVAAIAMVFMTTSFHVVSEHIPAYAAATLAAVWLLTVRTLRLSDGLVLVGVALFCLRCHEVFVYLGPLLAAIAVWTVSRAGPRPRAATACFVAAAMLLLLSGLLALHSVVTDDDRAYFEAAASEAWDFWKNPTFVLALLAAATVLAWALIRPRELASARPYAWALPAVLALAATPLLAGMAGWFGPPYAYGQNIARLPAGLVTTAVILFMWAGRAEWRFRPKAFAVLATPQAGRRFRTFAFLTLLATVPWNVTLVGVYASYLDAVQEAVDSEEAVVAFEESGLADVPRLLQGEGWSMPITSALLRHDAEDAVIAPPSDYDGWAPYDARSLPELGPYLWPD